MRTTFKAKVALTGALCALAGCAGSTPIAPANFSSVNGLAVSAATPIQENDAYSIEPRIERLKLATMGVTFREVRLDGSRAYGILHELSHFDDGYRGNSPNGFLFLSEPAPGRISGVIGTGALTTINFHEDANAGTLQADGRWAARMFGLKIAHDEISVSQFKCSDVYRRVNPEGDTFIGKPSCWQSSLGHATLHVPEAFFKRTPSEQVVFMSAFLL